MSQNQLLQEKTVCLEKELAQSLYVILITPKS